MTTVITDDRENALRIGYAATDWTIPVSFPLYCVGLADWRVRLIKRDGENIGAVFDKNGEIHVSVVKKWRGKWATKGILKEILFNQTKTKITTGHDYMYGVMRRLGFTLVDGNEVRKE